jgi:16S rRNA (guanine(966)-N(2))-methyltransferase RsmD
MRVIAGEFRSRSLAAPAGMNTRPTSDKLRETLFNVLAHWPGVELRGAAFADLFAGCGAVGIEALSRGAAHCFFVEQAGPAIAAIRKNLTALKIGDDRATVLRSDAAEFARAPARQMNFIFLDPPYDDAEAYSQTLHAIAAADALLPRGIVIAEHAVAKSRQNGFAPADEYGSLHRVRLLEQGDAALSFYSR